MRYLWTRFGFRFCWWIHKWQLVWSVIIKWHRTATCLLGVKEEERWCTMSLFGTSSGFGTGGTGVFGSTTTDSHNPMKVNRRSTWVKYLAWILINCFDGLVKTVLSRFYLTALSFSFVVYVSVLSHRMLKWLHLQMTASAVLLSVHPRCQGTSSLEDPGPTMWVIHFSGTQWIIILIWDLSWVKGLEDAFTRPVFHEELLLHKIYVMNKI